MPNATAVSRRVGTDAFKYRLRSRDVFTVLYSSVMVSAVVADSTRKNADRKALGSAIEDAKADLKKLEDRQQSRVEALLKKPNLMKLKAHGQWTRENRKSRVDAIQSCSAEEVKRMAVQGRWTWEDIFEWTERETRRRESLGFKDWTGIPLRILENTPKSKIDDGLRTDPLLNKMANNADSKNIGDPTRSFSWKKVKTLEWSVTKLVSKYLWHSPEPQVSMDNDCALDQLSSDSQGKNVKKSLREIDFELALIIRDADNHILELRRIPQESKFNFQGFQSPQAPRYQCLYDHYKVALLNRNIAEIFHAFRREEETLAPLIDKICYQLLASSVPPNIETYTILMINFGALGFNTLVRKTLLSAQESHIRPDENAITALLDFYSSTQNTTGFRILTGKIKGFHGGFSLAHPDIKVTPLTLSKYRFMTGLKKKKTKNYTDSNIDPRNETFPKHAPSKIIRIYQKPPMNEEVYGALIHGGLNLFGDKQAMVNYINLINEGYKATIEILTYIIQYCCVKRDWDGGMFAWEKIQDTDNGADFHAYRWMLRLCQVCRYRRMFRELIREGIGRGVLPSSIRCFKEQIASMEADTLIKLTKKHEELAERLRAGSILREPLDQLVRYLAVISFKIAGIAKRFGDIELSVGHFPGLGNTLCDRIELERDEIMTWARTLSKEKREGNKVMYMELREEGERMKEALGGEGFETKESLARFQSGNAALGRLFNTISYLINHIARSIGDVELAIRYAPTVGHMLAVKIRLSYKSKVDPFGCPNYQISSYEQHLWDEDELYAERLRVRLQREFIRYSIKRKVMEELDFKEPPRLPETMMALPTNLYQLSGSPSISQKENAESQWLPRERKLPKVFKKIIPNLSKLAPQATDFFEEKPLPTPTSQTQYSTILPIDETLRYTPETRQTA